MAHPHSVDLAPPAQLACFSGCGPEVLEAIELHLSVHTGPGSGAFYALDLAGLRFTACRTGLSLRDAMARCLDSGVWPLRFKDNHGLFTAAEQARLLRRRAAVIGCGGLGGIAALLLARAGLGGLTLCDSGAFSESDLNRSLCRESAVGCNKASAVREQLLAAASHLEVAVRAETAAPAGLPDILEGCHVMLDCRNTPARPDDLETAARACKIPVIPGAVTGLEGLARTGRRAAAGGPPAEPSVRPGPREKDAAASVGALTPALVGALQAWRAVNVLLGREPDEAWMWRADFAAPAPERSFS